ncbi:MAG: hypothetical protein WCX95_04155, partial [Candidatus Gracilibacteria bacterium]
METQSRQPNETPQLKEKITALNTWIQAQLEQGKVQYDRSPLKTDYKWEDHDSDGIAIQAPKLEDVAEKGTQKWEEEGKLHGTCRDIAPALAKILEQSGHLKNPQILACTNDGEFHYVVVGEIETDDGGSGRVLVDMGYSQPVPQAVLINGGLQESSYYNGEMGKGQIYNGNVTYEAIDSEKGVDFMISYKQGQETKTKIFKFQPATEVDRDIVSRFGSVTGKMSRTEVVTNGDTRRINRVDDPAENSFKKLYDLYDLMQ